ncbi:MAG: iron-sulfur cluster assembly scaffold protein [Caenibius sp.]
MNAAGAPLYTPELLELALRLAQFPLAGDWPLQGHARSVSCGSEVSIGLRLNQTGTIAAIGLKAQACAIGQAACAIFANAAPGLDLQAITAARADCEAWLAGNAPLPDWPGMAPLAPAQAYPGRHGAILLPWRAALDALCNRSDTV